jgi:hypothetical protein
MKHKGVKIITDRERERNTERKKERKRIISNCT